MTELARYWTASPGRLVRIQFGAQQWFISSVAEQRSLKPWSWVRAPHEPQKLEYEKITRIKEREW